jgi:cytochrome c556
VGVRVAMCVAFVLAFGGMAVAQEPSVQPEPILETGELMLLVIKPAYDELRRAMAAPPADRQQWAALYQKAARLAEFENLILFRPHERSNTAEWKTFATNARKASMAVASAALNALANASAANVDEVKKAYGDVSVRCNACHRAMSREAPRITPD